MSSSAKIIVLLLLIYNFVTAILTKADKTAAAKGRWRRPEKHFFLFSITGGGLGVLISCYTFRHKTKSKPFLNQAFILTILAYMIIVACYNQFLR